MSAAPVINFSQFVKKGFTSSVFDKFDTRQTKHNKHYPGYILFDGKTMPSVAEIEACGLVLRIIDDKLYVYYDGSKLSNLQKLLAVLFKCFISTEQVFQLIKFAMDYELNEDADQKENILKRMAAIFVAPATGYSKIASVGVKICDGATTQWRSCNFALMRALFYAKGEQEGLMEFFSNLKTKVTEGTKLVINEVIVFECNEHDDTYGVKRTIPAALAVQPSEIVADKSVKNEMGKIISDFANGVVCPLEAKTKLDEELKRLCKVFASNKVKVEEYRDILIKEMRADSAASDEVIEEVKKRSAAMFEETDDVSAKRARVE